MLFLSVLKYARRRFDDRPLSVERSNFIPQPHKFEQLPRSKDHLVSIVIPTRDRKDLLQTCVESILYNTKGVEFELVIANNNSVALETLEYFKLLRETGVKVVNIPGEFNYSRICNVAIQASSGDIICLLNNDTKIIDSKWLASMVSHLQDNNVGVVGSDLRFADMKVQHLGLALGLKGIAGHIGRGMNKKDRLVRLLSQSCFQVSAVTFACAAFRRETFNTLKGLDEKLKVGFNDLDFCLRATELGLRNVLCSQSQLLHLESQSRRKMTSFLGATRAALEVVYMLRKYPTRLDGDQYFLQ